MCAFQQHPHYISTQDVVKTSSWAHPTLGGKPSPWARLELVILQLHTPRLVRRAQDQDSRTLVVVT